MASIPNKPAIQQSLKFEPNSSFLMAVEYDPNAKAMTITFKNGTQYKYLSIFPATFESFRLSPDHSSFYTKAIKGKSLSVPVVQKAIGRQHRTALSQPKQRRTLKHGNVFDRNAAAGNIPPALRK